MGANGSNGHQPVPEDAEPPLEAWVPGPGWQRRAAPLGRRRLDRRRLRLLLAGAGGALLLVAWTLAFTSGVRSVQPTVEDDVFLADAGDVCGRVRDRLAAEAEGRRGEELGDAERAGAVDTTVDALAAMVGDLRRLRPSGADGAEVAAWLDDWEQVLESGRRTADALRRSDHEAADAAARSGQEPARAVNAFAGANGVPACGTAPA